MPKTQLVRNIISGDEVQDAIRDGVNAIYKVALASYGANSGNVMIEHRYGEPLISHDGITNVGKLVLEDATENAAVSVVRQASEKTNRDAGDSTTLTIVLTKLAYDHWSKQGLTPRATAAAINDFTNRVVEHIRASKKAVTPETLQAVSRISAGDHAIGDLVFDAVQTVGSQGGITVVETAVPQISSEIIEGFTFKKGLKAVALANDIQALKSRFEDPAIVVMTRLVSKNDDIMPILDRVVRSGKTNILLVADVSGQALETIIRNKLEGRLDIAIVEPPTNDRDAFLSDLAQYASTKVFAGSAADESFDVQEYVGSAESAYVTLSETTINGCQTPDELEAYCENIDEKHRLEMLQGKTVRISVGAPTQAERQELKLRIEDAVCAAQTAHEYGVLPGGGTFLRDFDPNGYLAKPFQILTNTPDDMTWKPGEGINITTDEVHDSVYEAGIVDSAKAIEEAVINSHSAAAQLLSVRLALTYAEDME